MLSYPFWIVALGALLIGLWFVYESRHDRARARRADAAKEHPAE